MEQWQVFTIVSSLLEVGGVVTFVFFLVRGLSREIGTMKKTVEAQKQTLEVMEKRILETEKIGELYRKMVQDFPDDFERYRRATSEIKDKTISELEKANQQKDDRLKSLSELELKKLEVQERALAELPRLRAQLVATVGDIEERLSTVSRYRPASFAEVVDIGEPSLGEKATHIDVSGRPVREKPIWATWYDYPAGEMDFGASYYDLARQNVFELPVAAADKDVTGEKGTKPIPARSEDEENRD